MPKPVVKKIEREEDEEKQERNYSERLPEEEELTELQLYEMKHEQLKKMIHNQYWCLLEPNQYRYEDRAGTFD